MSAGEASPRLSSRTPTALITGASSGIGRELARFFARDGFALVLASRSAARLAPVVSQLRDAHGASVTTIPADLGKPDDIERLFSTLTASDIRVDVLVNNAGFGGAGRFDKLDASWLRRMVELNCAVPVALTRALLPPMRERGRGAVVFVGSVAGCQPLPLHSLYAATKSFDNLLGEALWAEYRGSGVDCLSLLPGPTETEFQAIARELPHPGEPPEQVVENALAALGRQPSVISGWFNWARATLVGFLPRSAVTLAAHRVIARQTPDAMR
jgi:short-subunit dehydrogenase